MPQRVLKHLIFHAALFEELDLADGNTAEPLSSQGIIPVICFSLSRLKPTLDTFSENSELAQDTYSCIRSPLLHRRGAIEVFDQTRPVFKPPLATRADGQMLGPLRQKELAHIKGDGADLVVRTTAGGESGCMRATFGSESWLVERSP